MKTSIVILMGILFFSAYHFLTMEPAEKNKKSYYADYELRHRKIINRIPDDLTFAGEKIHFKSPEAYSKYYRELNLNTLSNASTRLLLKKVNILLPEIEKTLLQNGIPSDMKYIAVCESNLDICAKSNKGAAGLWQFTDVTAIEYGLEVNEEIDERFNWQKSTLAACKYFQQAYALFGTWTSAAASYNRGIGGLQSAFLKQSVNSYYDLNLNKETSKYIFRILALKDLISSPKKYNIIPTKSRKIPVQIIKIDTTINDLRAFTLLLNLNYDVIKESNPWILKNSVTIKKPNGVYYLTVPSTARIVLPQIADTTKAKSFKGISHYKTSKVKKSSTC